MYPIEEPLANVFFHEDALGCQWNQRSRNSQKYLLILLALYRNKVVGPWSKNWHTTNEKKIEIVILISDIICFREKNITRDKKSHLIMINGLIYQEFIKILMGYNCFKNKWNLQSKKCTAKQTHLQLVGHFYCISQYQ